MMQRPSRIGIEAANDNRRCVRLDAAPDGTPSVAARAAPHRCAAAADRRLRRARPGRAVGGVPDRPRGRRPARGRHCRRASWSAGISAPAPSRRSARSITRWAMELAGFDSEPANDVGRSESQSVLLACRPSTTSAATRARSRRARAPLRSSRASRCRSRRSTTISCRAEIVGRVEAIAEKDNGLFEVRIALAARDRRATIPGSSSTCCSATPRCTTTWCCTTSSCRPSW